ncbi:adenylate cyclase, partial [Salmonella enterica subsp. enterica serovar Typhimurium]|nr:adenylate cyclase [Salmonella enterica subsp. enterica serovar Typhimurium]
MYLYIETLKQRLDAINQLRLERAFASMSDVFKQVYGLIPVLLHYHHPQLPGYIQGNVPHGTCFFEPDDVQRQWVNKLTNASCDEPMNGYTSGELPITGIYSMGSTSSIGQSHCSDIDIWVCRQSWLDQ